MLLQIQNPLHPGGYADPEARFLCIDKMNFNEKGDLLPIIMTEKWSDEL